MTQEYSLGIQQLLDTHEFFGIECACDVNFSSWRFIQRGISGVLFIESLDQATRSVRDLVTLFSLQYTTFRHVMRFRTSRLLRSELELLW